MTGPVDKSVIAAIKAWEAGKCSDHELDLAIIATETALVVLRAYGANWVSTMGLQTTLTSMTGARASRQREDRRRGPAIPSQEFCPTNGKAP